MQKISFKGLNIDMEDKELLKILERIEILLIKSSKVEAREYTRIEIDNLEGKVPNSCKNTKYYYFFCNYCSNKNCTKYMGDQKATKR